MLKTQKRQKCTGEWRICLESGVLYLSDCLVQSLGIPLKESYDIEYIFSLCAKESKELCRLNVKNLTELGDPFIMTILILDNKNKVQAAELSGLALRKESENVLEIGGVLKIGRDLSLSKNELDLIRADVGTEILHEVMGPMTILKNSASHIKSYLEKENTAKVYQKLDVIQSTIIHVQDTFKSMRSLLQKEIKIKEIDIKDIITKVRLLNHDKLTDNDISLSLLYETDDTIVKGIAGELIQILTILINNSIEAIKDLDDKWIEINVLENPKGLKIKIVDSGEGISSELHQKIFEKHFTTKQADGGTGIGLDLCLKLLSRVNGEISIDDSSSNTAFDIILSRNL